MAFSLESLASLATIAGLLLSILGMMQAREWLVLTSLCSAALAVGVCLYARRVRKAVEGASVVIDGHSIDALNIANLRRRVNRRVMLQEVDHNVEISGEDMIMSWRYAGFCRAKTLAEMEFTINSEAGTRFGELGCIAYDLENDPERKHPIRPRLVGADGISKKIAVPFLEGLEVDERFELLLRFKLPRCARDGFSYYISSLSFGQNRVRRSAVKLDFQGRNPNWVRVYECSTGSATLLKALAPESDMAKPVIYSDVVEERPGQSVRVYAFWRGPV